MEKVTYSTFNERNPKFLCDNSSSITSPDVPVAAVSSMTDCNAYAGFRVNKVRNPWILDFEVVRRSTVSPFFPSNFI